LRDDRNAPAALAVLDEYGRRFPQGALGLEAGMLRAEALLSLGRSRDALAELDRLPMQLLPNRDGRLALRGELRAAAGRFRDAIADYDAVLAKSATGAEVERALWGRASARSHLGNDDGARSDLGQYLLRFPHGRFADEARRLLGGP
jgi:tetratricopeptide (TPR) repeat protein